MDEFQVLLEEAHRHAAARRGLQWRQSIQAALKVEAAEPPALARAKLLSLHGAVYLPAAERLPLLARAVTIAQSVGEVSPLRAMVVAWAQAAEDAAMPGEALPALRAMLDAPDLTEEQRRDGERVERALRRLEQAQTKAAAPKRAPRRTRS